MFLTKGHRASPVGLISAFLFCWVATIWINLANSVAFLLHLFGHLYFMEHSGTNISHLSISDWVHILTRWISIFYLYIILLIWWITYNTSLLCHKSLREASPWAIILYHMLAVGGVLIIDPTAIIKLLHLKYLVSKWILYYSIKLWERLLHWPIPLVVKTFFAASPAILRRSILLFTIQIIWVGILLGCCCLYLPMQLQVLIKVVTHGAWLWTRYWWRRVIICIWSWLVLAVSSSSRQQGSTRDSLSLILSCCYRIIIVVAVSCMGWGRRLSNHINLILISHIGRCDYRVSSLALI